MLDLVSLRDKILERVENETKLSLFDENNQLLKDLENYFKAFNLDVVIEGKAIAVTISYDFKSSIGFDVEFTLYWEKYYFVDLKLYSCLKKKNESDY